MWTCSPTHPGSAFKADVRALAALHRLSCFLWARQRSSHKPLQPPQTYTSLVVTGAHVSMNMGAGLVGWLRLSPTKLEAVLTTYITQSVPQR